MNRKPLCLLPLLMLAACSSAPEQKEDGDRLSRQLTVYNPIDNTDAQLTVSAQVIRQRYLEARDSVALVLNFAGNQTGSCVFLTPTLAVTAQHVVTGASGENDIGIVMRDARQARATLLETSEEYDLALLRIRDLSGTAPGGLLLRTEGPAMGERVLAIGWAAVGQDYLMTQSLRDGIVSRTDVRHRAHQNIRYFTVTAPINQGDSGCALISLANGRLMGIPVGVLEGEDQGLVIWASQIIAAFPSKLRVSSGS